MARIKQNAYQTRIDNLILILFLLLVVTLVGLTVDILALVILPLPLMMALLMFLATLEKDGRWKDKTVVAVLAVFNLVSFALWFGAWLTVGDNTITIGGLPLNTGLLVLVGWPLYTLLSGPLYAFCVERKAGSGKEIEGQLEPSPI